LKVIKSNKKFEVMIQSKILSGVMRPPILGMPLASHYTAD